jgi:L-methionine (R)-S-oxide reductase
MSEGILLPPLARGTLLPVAERVARLEAALPQITAAIEGETDAVGPAMLAVGPYQGTMGCLRIDFARGVCGACARTREVQLVPDVAKFEGHIACDSATQSELVLPLVAGGELRGVLDLDSKSLDAFAAEEARLLAGLLTTAFAHASF